MQAPRNGIKRYLPFIAGAVLLLSALLPSCKKQEDNSVPVLSVRDKLLGTWRRNFRAYDVNGDGRIDSTEIYHSATDTLMLTLVPDDSYIRTLYFKGPTTPENGTWHLQKSDSQIVLQPTTSSSRIDTFRLDTVAQDYFLQHTAYPNIVHYYEGYVRP